MTRPHEMQTAAGSARGWLKHRLGEFSLDVSWEVLPGEILTLFGPSGAGKTTLLRAIAGLIRPQEGHIEIGRRVVFDSAAGGWVPPHHRQVGFLTQDYHLFPHLSVSRNIAYGLSGLTPQSRQARVRELIETFKLAGLEDRTPNEISGGQQQRAALARALAPSPAIILLDEPFNALDLELRRALRSELRSSIVATGIPAILVTHDIEESISLGDHVLIMDIGRVVARGRPIEVLGQPGQGRVARIIGVENLLGLKVISRHPQDGTMVCATGDGSLRLEVPLSDASDGEPVTVGIRASDIILAHSEPTGSSARNRLAGVVSQVQLRPPGYQVTLQCQGIDLQCHITGTSLNEMGVRQGSHLWAVFKASSCFLVSEGEQ